MPPVPTELELLAAEIRANSLRTSTTRHRIAELLDTLGLVHKELDGKEWSPETPENIAGFLDAQGLQVAAFDWDHECEHCQAELDPAESGNCANCGGWTEV